MRHQRSGASDTSTARASRTGWLAVLAAAVLLAAVAPGPVAAASQDLAPGCSGVNLRTSASTTAPIKVKLSLGSTVTVSGAVAGARWGTSCPTWKSGSTWYAVSHVNGRPVLARYGVPVLFAATGVLTAPAGGPPSAAPPIAPDSVAAPPAAAPAVVQAVAANAASVPGTALVPACASVNVRTSASTRGVIKAKLGPTTALTVSGTVAGSAWSAACPTPRSGSSWYVITQVNGRAVGALYGVPLLFAATGVLVPQTASNQSLTQDSSVTTPAAETSAPASTLGPTPTAAPAETPAPALAPTPAPVATPSPAAPAAAPGAPIAPAAGVTLVSACAGVNLRMSASTSSTIKVKLALASPVTVAGTIGGSTWSTACPTFVSGSSWYVVTQVGGQPVNTLYGVPALYAASGVLTAPAGTPSTTTTGPAPSDTAATASATTASATTASATTVFAAAPSGATLLGATTTFYGRGYGHGVGMSQYGARGRALAGQSAAQILAQYYAGTTIGSIPLDTAIRVLVLDNFAPTSTAPLTIHGRGGPWSVSGTGLEFPADARLRLYPPAYPTALWRALVETAAAQVLYDGPLTPDFRVGGLSDATTIQLFSKPSTYDLFRGTLRVIASGSLVDVVNELPLETYLRGVVPAEMPTSWPVEARIAQTIVARSYAAFQLRPATGTFDVHDDTRSQVYLGVRQEKPDADAVIASTAGQVLRYGSALVNALFHSTAGGATENNENVFVSPAGARVATPVAYLRGSSDRDPAGVPYDAGAPYATWQTKAYTVADLSAIFAKDGRTSVGVLTSLDLRNRGVSGRLISVTLTGTSGIRTVSGAVFLAAFNAGKPSTDPPLRGTLLDVAPIP